MTPFFFIFLTLFFSADRTTAESLTNQNEAELQRRFQDRQQEIDQMQQVLETKIQLLQEVCLPLDLDSPEGGAFKGMTSFSSTAFQEAQLARSEAERMASLAGSQSHASLLSLDTPMEEVPDDERPPKILAPADTTKDR